MQGRRAGGLAWTPPWGAFQVLGLILADTLCVTPLPMEGIVLRIHIASRATPNAVEAPVVVWVPMWHVGWALTSTLIVGHCAGTAAIPCWWGRWPPLVTGMGLKELDDLLTPGVRRHVAISITATVNRGGIMHRRRILQTGLREAVTIQLAVTIRERVRGGLECDTSARVTSPVDTITLTELLTIAAHAVDALDCGHRICQRIARRTYEIGVDGALLHHHGALVVRPRASHIRVEANRHPRIVR